MSHLLDANALIALCWPPHEHHERMLVWFRANARHGWATSPLTQAALVRIVCQPAFAGRAVSVHEAGELLLRNAAHAHHRLLPLDFGFEHVPGCCTGGLFGHRQITDAWLLTQAIRAGAKLLTFDAGIEQLLSTPAERARHIALLA